MERQKEKKTNGQKRIMKRKKARRDVAMDRKGDVGRVRGGGDGSARKNVLTSTASLIWLGLTESIVMMKRENNGEILLILSEKQFKNPRGFDLQCCETEKTCKS